MISIIICINTIIYSKCFYRYSRWDSGCWNLGHRHCDTPESTALWLLLNILSPMQRLSFSVIGSVIQADCIKAISAKWNMCPVSAAHSLFIRLLTSETNLKKNKAVYGPMGWRSTRWCHPGDVLLVDLFRMLLTFPSPEGSTHLRVRVKGKGGGGVMFEKGKVYQGLGCPTFVRVNLGKTSSPKFKEIACGFSLSCE